MIIIRLFVVLLASPYLELILCRRRKLLHSVACPCGLAYLFPFAFYVLINAVICTAYLRPRKLNAVSANTAYLQPLASLRIGRRVPVCGIFSVNFLALYSLVCPYFKIFSRCIRQLLNCVARTLAIPKLVVLAVFRI